MSVHQLIAEGTGHFSRGRCSSCPWAYRGHIEDVYRIFEQYHREEREPTLPHPITVPPPSGEPVQDIIEARLIRLLAHAISYSHVNAQYMAQGLAEARSAIVGEPMSTALDYMADMVAKISHLPKRQRAKLLGPGIDRVRMQEILEQGSGTAD